MNLRSRMIAGLTIALVPLLATACVRTAATDRGDVDAAETTGASFPITVQDCGGRPTTFDAAPEKVVTANLAALELVIRLGKSDRVAGTGWATGIATLPDDVREIAQSTPVLSAGAIPKEVLLTAGADAYIDAFGSMQMMGGDGMSEQDFADAGMSHVFLASSACASTLPAARANLDEVYRDIENIGAVLDASGAAADLIEQMRSTVSAATAGASAPSERPSVFYYSPDATSQGMTTVGGKQIANAVYELAGARNAFADDTTSMKPVSWEDVIAADPDYIQIATRHKASPEERAAAFAAAVDTLRNDPRARDLRAVREGRFIDLGAEETTLPGIENADAVATIAEAIGGR
ncbi:ABC transporter substrate-binding protein [Rhodococcus sp. IEGM 1354]|uniref:ABC transporter substrate-binding protein n=1 Tax=Rhodococcus sp. IEGM 1354 TaxID=3047088 RepID=UPI0024B78E54|nr:ABC transporter substrate-binding protein [Rhodococcus sp. IEGM 1354]MDI9929707.1 ABC transporter substrate-binding protein [Rhodococcus sp. IEGM 1354]